LKRIKIIFCVAALCVSAIGCGDQQAQNELSGMKAEKALLEANKALVLRAHEEVWNSGNTNVVEKIYSADYIAHWAYGEDTDREGLKKMVAEARAAFPDMKEDIVHIVAEGDLVVTHFISSGTFTGEMNGLQASGQKLSRPEIAIHKIVNGMIAEQWTVSDQMTLMKQLGLM